MQFGVTNLIKSLTLTIHRLLGNCKWDEMSNRTAYASALLHISPLHLDIVNNMWYFWQCEPWKIYSKVALAGFFLSIYRIEEFKMALKPQKLAQHKNTPQARQQGKYSHSPSNRSDSDYESIEKPFSPSEPRFKDRIRTTTCISIGCYTLIPLLFVATYAFGLLETQRNGIIKCTSFPPSCLMEFSSIQKPSESVNGAKPQDTNKSK